MTITEDIAAIKAAKVLASEYRPTMTSEVLHSWAADVSAELRRLIAALEEAQKDAERYRWLRDKSPPEWELTVASLPCWKFDIDAAIDAAMEQTK